MSLEMSALEDRFERAESQGFARAEFLRQIQNLRPECLVDLCASAFYEFLMVALERFKDEILKDSGQAVNSGYELLILQFLTALRELISPESYNLSIGDVLCVAFGKLLCIDSGELERAFPDWKQLKNLGYAKSLRSQVDAWSKKWNLDEDWCRDHAITAVRNCLTDDYLKWSFLRYTDSLLWLFSEWQKESVTADVESDFRDFLVTRALALLREHNGGIGKGWDRAVNEVRIRALWSGFSLSVKVHRGDPEPFIFQWRDIEFNKPGFNVLKESQNSYKRRVSLAFRMLLNERERQGLMLAMNAESTTCAQFFSANRGLLNRFRTSLDKHVRKTANLSKEAHKNLVKIRPRPQLTKHLKWTIEYQLPPTKGLVEVADAYKR